MSQGGEAVCPEARSHRYRKRFGLWHTHAPPSLHRQHRRALWIKRCVNSARKWEGERAASTACADYCRPVHNTAA